MVQMSLLSLSHEVSYEISVGGMAWRVVRWRRRSVNDMPRSTPDCSVRLRTEDDESACPALKDKGIELIAIEGGHQLRRGLRSSDPQDRRFTETAAAKNTRALLLSTC